MHALTILQGLALALSAVSAQGRVHNRRQNGPVDPSTASDCTLFDDAVDATYTCKYFEDLWALPHKDFVDWVSVLLQPGWPSLAFIPLTSALSSFRTLVSSKTAVVSRLETLTALR